MMETESVHSAHSQYSSRSRHGHGRLHHANHTGHNKNAQRSYSQRSRHSHRSGRSTERSKGCDPLEDYDGGPGPGPGGGGGGDEVIEVQILPQDDNWGDGGGTVVSDRSMSAEDRNSKDQVRYGDRYSDDGSNRLGVLFKCQRYLGSVVAAILSAAAFASPVAMVTLPRLGLWGWREENLVCGPECDSLLISFAFKLLILLVGTWAVFVRPARATMPRIFVLRAVVLAFVVVFTFAYWLFYGVRVLERRDEVSYYSVVQFSTSLVDALLFIHYLAILLMEVRHLQPQYSVKVVRSPDGQSRFYTMGQLSVQRAAVFVLDSYYRDFAVYNPYLERVPAPRARTKGGAPSTVTSVASTALAGPGFKFYDVDGVGVGNATQSRALLAATARRRDSSHNERFYEEHEYDRRVKKRRARLITAAEEAFTHIKRLHEEQGPAIPMDPLEAAQSIFPSMARALQKYLRVTRQQPRHTMESILQHLAVCLSFDLSPKAFLEKYLESSGVLQSDREQREVQTWALVCDMLLSRAVQHGTIFQLRQGDVALLCTVQRLPHFNITEEVIDPKNNKFVLRLNSETSV